MVHTGLAALISGIGSKVEHIPEVSCPHEGTLVKEIKHILIVNALIFLRLISSLRVGGVKVRHTLAAVLGVAESTVGVTLVEVVNPQIVKPHKGSVPAEIKIPAYNIRKVSNRVKGSAHSIARKGGGTAGVHLVNKIVKDLMVFHHILLILGGYGNLVGDTPNADRGVVIALYNKLLHLADGIFSTVRHMLGNIGDLCPYDHTVLVAEVIEILVVLIVGKTNGVGTNLTDHLHIGIVVLLGNCITDALPVLVTTYATKGIGLAVKEEAVLRVHAE